MKKTLGVLILVLILTPAVTRPAEKGAPMAMAVTQKLRNERPAFAVRVAVDRPDRLYRHGELMHLSVTSGRDGYLYLLYQSAEGKLGCLFPNRIQQENRIAAGVPVVVPKPGANFRLRVGPPYGREVLKAVVTLKPIRPSHLGVKSLITREVTPLKLPAAWAEHHVQVTTIPAGKTPEARRRRRVALLVGISRYQDPKIRPLTVSHDDAVQLQQVMKRRSKLDELILLTDREATLAAVRAAICRKLVQRTLPGDVVFIYWSGHGGRCADSGGDEPDGFDEYLVPYDGRLDDLATVRRTMLTDDTFGRWIQDLDGRRVVLILDTCHSGGQSIGAKAPGAAKTPGAPKAPPPNAPFDFLDGELARAKDIGQKETALLCSATSSQIAFGRREGDLSTMTWFLVALLRQDTGPLTLTETFDHLKIQVPAYVKQKFPGTTQTPVLINHLTGQLHLRP